MYDAIQTWVGALPSAVQFVLVIVLVFVCGHYLGRPAVNIALRRYGVAEPIRDAVEDSFHPFLFFTAVVVALATTEISAMPSSSGVIIAAVTLSAGIGAREIIRNLVSGLFIVNNEDIDVGSWIEWDGNTGVVESVSLRVTKIRTFDDETLVVPNSKLTDDVVVAPASSGQLRLRYEFDIGYEHDIEKAIDTILAEAKDIDGVVNDPGPTVRVSELGESAVKLDARVWLDGFPGHGKAVRVRSELLRRVKARFQEEDITMPAPIRTLDGSIDVSGADDR